MSSSNRVPGHYPGPSSKLTPTRSLGSTHESTQAGIVLIMIWRMSLLDFGRSLKQTTVPDPVITQSLLLPGLGTKQVPGLTGIISLRVTLFPPEVCSPQIIRIRRLKLHSMHRQHIRLQWILCMPLHTHPPMSPIRLHPLCPRLGSPPMSQFAREDLQLNTTVIKPWSSLEWMSTFTRSQAGEGGRSTTRMQPPPCHRLSGLRYGPPVRRSRVRYGCSLSGDL